MGRAAGVQQMLWIVVWLGPEGQGCLSPKSEGQALDSHLRDQGKYTLGVGRGCDFPGGVWVGLDLLEEHVKSVGIVAVHQEV